MEKTKGKVLILGATSDIAVALANKFAGEGFSLVLASRKTSKLEPIQKDIQIRYNVSVDLVAFDALEFKSHEQFYNDLSEKPIITICVFGYLGDHSLAISNWEETLKIINSNYTGAVSILNIVAKDYETKQNGCIIGISSVAGERGRQSNYLYGSAKAGFTAYLSGLRNRLYKSNVHVITVKPGFVDTKMTEGLRLPKPLTAQPKKVANDIFSGYKSKKNVIYTLPLWKYIMLIINYIPESIFKKLKL